MSGIFVNKVLVDSDTAISFLPKRMMVKVGKHFNDLVPTNISVIDYNGISTPAKRLVTLQVQVGSSVRTNVFIVVSSRASYNALLCRDWIQGVGVVPLTVHKKLLLWTCDEKTKVVEADDSVYVEQMHIDFKVCNDKLKLLDVDGNLDYYNYEGYFLTSEGLNKNLRHPKLEYTLIIWE
ncbi:hypothetical protein Ahy_B03g063917 [Arachis hypogaea]|uniref:Uncharacterized protein n=1 Tax=Arachis hypogaea TaxID=3818 RepID=A0A444ZYE8_ARAHY|nr:hypothetical protein Ahy_B03g063917 [Arachis hypogaea]